MEKQFEEMEMLERIFYKQNNRTDSKQVNQYFLYFHIIISDFNFY